MRGPNAQTDALGEDVRDVGDTDAPDQCDSHGHQEQGGEAVQPELRHQEEQDQHADPDHHERHVSVLLRTPAAYVHPSE
jgi:hypothetical protein